MAELVDARDSKSCFLGSAGSIPAAGIDLSILIACMSQILSLALLRVAKYYKLIR